MEALKWPLRRVLYVSYTNKKQLTSEYFNSIKRKINRYNPLKLKIKFDGQFQKIEEI